MGQGASLPNIFNIYLGSYCFLAGSHLALSLSLFFLSFFLSFSLSILSIFEQLLVCC